MLQRVWHPSRTVLEATATTCEGVLADVVAARVDHNRVSPALDGQLYASSMGWRYQMAVNQTLQRVPGCQGVQNRSRLPAEPSLPGRPAS